MSNTSSIAGIGGQIDLGSQEPAEASRPKSVRSLAVSGAAWSVGTLATSQLLRMVSSAILSQLLFPEVFGLTTLATSIAKGLQMFTDVGIGPNIVQNAEGENRSFVNTAWTLQVLRGCFLFVALGILSLPVAIFYHEPKLRWVVVAVGVSAILNGFGSTSLHLLSRRLAIGTVSLLGLAENVIMVVVTIALAWLRPNVWSVVGGWYAGSLFRLVMSHFINRQTPNRFCWDRVAARSLFRFGRWIFVSTAITFFAAQLDRLLLGNFVSMRTLGIYGIAYSLASVPYNITARLAQVVLFPALSQVARGDESLLNTAVLAARHVILSVGLVAVVCIATAAPTFVRHVYDARYADVAPLAQILCLYFWFSILQASADRALLVVADTRSLAFSNGVNVAVTLGGCIIGYSCGGILGFAAGLSASSLAGHIVVQRALVRRGVHIAAQDIRYTAAAFGFGAIGTLLCPAIQHFGAVRLSEAAEIGLSVPVMVCLTLHAFRILRSHVFSNSA